jgi:hypothetical protein
MMSEHNFGWFDKLSIWKGKLATGSGQESDFTGRKCSKPRTSGNRS